MLQKITVGDTSDTYTVKDVDGYTQLIGEKKGHPDVWGNDSKDTFLFGYVPTATIIAAADFEKPVLVSDVAIKGQSQLDYKMFNVAADTPYDLSTLAANIKKNAEDNPGNSGRVLLLLYQQTLLQQL